MPLILSSKEHFPLSKEMFTSSFFFIVLAFALLPELILSLLFRQLFSGSSLGSLPVNQSLFWNDLNSSQTMFDEAGKCFPSSSNPSEWWLNASIQESQRSKWQLLPFFP